jgi:hypothetical protein
MTRNVGQQQPPQPQQVYDVVEPGKPNGARILFACRYDARLCASIIAVRDDWKSWSKQSLTLTRSKWFVTIV